MLRPFGQFFACRPHFFYTAAVLKATFLFLVLVVHCPLIRKLLRECEPNAIRGLARINEFLMWLVEAKVTFYISPAVNKYGNMGCGVFKRGDQNYANRSTARPYFVQYV